MEKSRDPDLSALLNESETLCALRQRLLTERRQLLQERRQLLEEQRAILDCARIVMESARQYMYCFPYHDKRELPVVAPGQQEREGAKGERTWGVLPGTLSQ
jgi:hypothetical protein